MTEELLFGIAAIAMTVSYSLGLALIVLDDRRKRLELVIGISFLVASTISVGAVICAIL